WAWMSRRTAAIAPASARMDSIMRMVGLRGAARDELVRNRPVATVRGQFTCRAAIVSRAAPRRRSATGGRAPFAGAEPWCATG
ncbi:MAG: hypothetical protein KGK18_01695, partial [Burkholderiales bacterium]|nr:hypothetical protein [Burkholderiales bacterium]